jgi:predicted phosphodiesterase
MVESAEEFVWLGEVGVIKTPKLELFLTDIHFPHEDALVWKLVKQIAREHQPDLVWLNGDIIDARSVSRFKIDPVEKFRLGDDLKHARARLRELRECVPNANIAYKEGNHDRRVKHFVWNHAEELSTLDDLELSNLLRLHELEIAYIGPEIRSKIGELFHIHGDEVKIGYANPARSLIQKIHANVICGHVHRFSVAYENALGGNMHVAQSIGCGQRLDVDFDFNPQWQQGFALIHYVPSGLFHIDAIEIFTDGGTKCCIVGGKLYKATSAA